MRHAILFILFMATGAGAFGQQLQDEPFGQASTATEQGPIQDNSFMVEEAYNQENGVIQHISTFQRLTNSRDWVYTQTDEWPLRTIKHQLSLTMAASHAGAYAGSGAGWGDTAINYRYQMIGSGETRTALASRFTLMMPTGRSQLGRGLGGYAMQTNLPLSVVVSKHFVTHWNAGATWAPHTRNDQGARAGTVGVNLGASAVWLAKQNFNVMLESVWTSSEDVVARGKTHRNSDFYVSPGLRWAYNFKSGLQIVPGVAMPIGAGPCAGEKGMILYLSFEHPFAWAKGK